MSGSQDVFFTQHLENDVIVVAFTQPLLNAASVTEAVTAIIASGKGKVILDCQSVRCLVSASLFPHQDPFRPLLIFNRQLIEKGGRLALCNVDPKIAEVLCVLRFDRLFAIHSNVTSAVAYLNR